MQARRCDTNQGMQSQQTSSAASARSPPRSPSSGLCLPGNLVERMTRCGSPRCRCHSDPARLHGPYPSWIRKSRTKTITRTLTPRPGRAIPSPVQQHQASPRADQ